ncbi:MAG: NADH dehydrogenase [candidate division Zixibacteria bacterium RBG_16_53_22]|nr:MAG: NADH dehydrogenase [candidate division Zixibacteria bacterium RBG_16_53_22]
MDFPILSWIVFLPLFSVLVLLFINHRSHSALKWTALLFTILDFVLTVVLFAQFDGSRAGMQFREGPLIWIRSMGVTFSLGVDGISILLVLLTPFLSAIALASAWDAIKEKVKGFVISMMLLQTGMLGVFTATDLFLFYIFWEVMLFPMYFLIGIWGGPRKIYAAVKFVLFTMFGSLLMLLGIIKLYLMTSTDPASRTTDLMAVLNLQITPELQFWLFLAFALAFAIKVPLFPFHTWLPDAHVEAPTAGSIILAGVLLKMGTYGFLRFCLPIFPNATTQLMPLISILALIGITYGALVAMVQKDVKSLVAYSSVAHLGFVMLGMFALTVTGLTGSIIQMINHGITTGALFLLVGMIYERRHTRLIDEFGGLAHVMPVFAAIFLIMTLASIGLPGTNGFVGEFLILLGTFRTNVTYAVIGTFGIVLAAVYMLWMVQRVFFGEITKDENRQLRDINWRERLITLPLIIMVFWIGIYPQTFIGKIEPSVRNLVQTVEQKRDQALRQEAPDDAQSANVDKVQPGNPEGDLR